MTPVADHDFLNLFQTALVDEHSPDWRFSHDLSACGTESNDVAGFRDDDSAAHDACLRALELSPGMTALHSLVGMTLARLGRTEEGLAEIAKEGSLGYRLHAGAIAHHLRGEPEEVDALHAKLIELGDDWASQIAAIHALRGRVDEAFRWLERAYDLRDPGIGTITVLWHLQSLHSDPRWAPFVAKVGLR